MFLRPPISTRTVPLFPYTTLCRSRVAICMENTGQVAIATVPTPSGVVTYEGDARIDGVPGTHAPIPIEFRDTAGSSCGALLPTGNAVDMVNGVPVTLIDNGMPCVVMKALDLGITGYEDREWLDANTELNARIEAIRLAVGERMNLGDVRAKSVPKMMLVAPPRARSAERRVGKEGGRTGRYRGG